MGIIRAFIISLRQCIPLQKLVSCHVKILHTTYLHYLLLQVMQQKLPRIFYIAYVRVEKVSVY